MVVDLDHVVTLYPNDAMESVSVSVDGQLVANGI